MQRKKISKKSNGSYQQITTEMRKKVINLVINYNMSLKKVKFILIFQINKAAHFVGIHP